MKVYIAFNPNAFNSIICVAESYKAAVKHLFGFHWISPKDEILIENQMTTLEEYFGEECVDMMAEEWDMTDFNEFWNSDFWIIEMEVVK